MNGILGDIVVLLPYIAAAETAVYAILWFRGKKYSMLHLLCCMTFTLGIAGIFSVTGVTPLSGFHTEIRSSEINLIPFYGMVDMLGSAIEGGDVVYAIINVVGNIVLFMPVGFGLPLLWKEFYSAKRTILCGFFLSLLIESSQLFLSRGTDIDDLILNTLGTVFGYVIFVKLYGILPRISGLSKERTELSLEAAGTIFLAYGTYLLLGTYRYMQYFN